MYARNFTYCYTSILRFLFYRTFSYVVTGSSLCRDRVSHSFSSYFYGISQRGTAASSSRPA